MFVGDEWKWTVAILFWGLVLASPFIILGYIFYRNLFQAEVAKKTKKKLKKLPDTRIAKFQRFYYKHRIISVFLVIFVAWALVWLSQAAVERYNFYRVEKTMDAISQDINAKFNVISEQKDRSCGTRDESFGSSLGGCSISYFYKISSGENKKTTAKSIDEVVGAMKDVKPRNPDPIQFDSTSFVYIDGPRINDFERYYSSYFFSTSKNPVCGAEYDLPKNKKDLFINVHLDCYLTGKDAKLPYFPVKD